MIKGNISPSYIDWKYILEEFKEIYFQYGLNLKMLDFNVGKKELQVFMIQPIKKNPFTRGSKKGIIVIRGRFEKHYPFVYK